MEGIRAKVNADFGVRSSSSSGVATLNYTISGGGINSNDGGDNDGAALAAGAGGLQWVHEDNRHWKSAQKKTHKIYSLNDFPGAIDSTI